MAYVSLYRKYRPQTFDEVVGQRHVTRSLTNALREDRLHHAYLFAGPRGTGKTSTARILAKSVNCVEGPTAQPCNACDQCVAITTGASVDVIELDMASHGGVDDARELRDRAQFAPASARRKVYILDEVHMASTAAFNALLKLIEEPPGHVLFAMATTDPQKVLPTILSRVQRLDLRRVGATDVAGRVRDLVTREGGTIDDAAVDLVVRAGDGSVRDTESVLEQVLAYAGGAVTGDDVVEVLGQTTFEHTAAAADAALAGDLAGAFAKVQDLLDDGTDLRQFTLDLVAHLRDLLVLVVAPNQPDLVDATADRRDALVAQSRRMDRDGLAVALDQLGIALEQMRQGPARLALELALARIATRPGAAPVPAQVSTGPGARQVELEADRGDQQVAAAAPTSASTTGDGPMPASRDDADGRADTDRDTDGSSGPDVGAAGDHAATPDAAGDTTDDAATGDAIRPATQAEAGHGEPWTEDRTEGATGQGRDVGSSGDLATRASARADQVARDGMPDVPSDRPAGFEVVVDEPATDAEAADLDDVAGRWEAIQALVGEQSKKGMAMLAPAQPVRLRNGTLTVEYPVSHAFHASSMQGEFLEVLGRAITQVTGASLRVAIQVEGEGPRRPHPPPMDGVPDDTGARSSGPASRVPREVAEQEGAPDDARARASSRAGVSAAVDAPDQALAPDRREGPDEPARAVPTPLAELDPAEAMDRAAGALVAELGATELVPDPD